METLDQKVAKRAGATGSQIRNDEKKYFDKELDKLFESAMKASAEAISVQRAIQAKAGTSGFETIKPIINQDLGVLIDIKASNLPFYYGSSYSFANAVQIPTGQTELKKTVVYTDTERGEINFALVNGQLLSTVYPTSGARVGGAIFGNGAAGALVDKVYFEQAYNFDVVVKSIAKIWLPTDREAVYLVDNGTLNLSLVELLGTIENNLAYERVPGEIGTSVSTGSGKRTFLNLQKIPEGYRHNEYWESFTQINEITIPAGIRYFYNSIYSIVTAITSKDFRDTSSLDVNNYGLALLDLRSRKFETRDKIAIKPFVGGFKSAPGGIRVHTTYEIYRK